MELASRRTVLAFLIINDLLGDEIVQSYENALQYFEDLEDVKQEFAPFFDQIS